ncbi:UbiH/UbiF/VisC/COQ6 family ubiquinone biosynthesis hydroxylase [Halocynthiibacter namhaensis]|uniref:UbiH/UbiF/VisC/COQ6 family ubiquinone biosynthesis hydroxylase n=1 Tax=Halocynthiibacter namhaensis TaxID=1290553 RepID=UPI00057902E2|nr:UbiH/UbiF/VisC/COQ6 family ubiquinone biosynthesis hydroxylase [Halocynthiibacter namhaensis]
MDNPHTVAIVEFMTCDSDILIAGGGLNGPSLALALADGGLNVTLVDAAPDGAREIRGFDGRCYALALASQRLFQAIGVWDLLDDNAQPILNVKVSDGRAGEGPGPFVMGFDHAEIEEGPTGYMVEDRFISGALREAVEKHPLITKISGAKVVSQHVDGAVVTVGLDTGESLTTRLLVGADGRGSGVAARAGIKRNGHSYHQTALVCSVEHALPHNATAHQFFMPDGPLAILPLPGNHSSIVWSTSDDKATHIASLDDDAFMEELRPVFGDFLGEISLSGARFTYPLTLSLAEHFVSERLALIGDAAHGVHPVAGQGLNLGLRDVGALAEVVIEARRRGEDFAAADVLARYEQWRRWDTTLLSAGMDGVVRLFSNDNPLLRAIRGLGLGAVNTMPSLRRNFIREAAGLTGDLPKLMQGRQV